MTSADEDVEKSGPSYTADGNVKWCSCCGKQCGSSSKNLNIELPNDLQSHFWAYTQENWKQGLKNICILIFIAAHNFQKAQAT